MEAPERVDRRGDAGYQVRKRVVALYRLRREVFSGGLARKQRLCNH